MISQKNKIIVKYFISSIIIIISTTIGGSIFRKEYSPWIWEQLEDKVIASTILDQIILVVSYVAFYLMGFLIPYWLITFLLFVHKRRYSDSQGVMTLSLKERNGRLFLSLSLLVLYLLLMKSIIAFINALPIDLWNGWFLIFGLVLSAFLAFSAYNEFINSNKNI